MKRKKRKGEREERREGRGTLEVTHYIIHIHVCYYA